MKSIDVVYAVLLFAILMNCEKEEGSEMKIQPDNEALLQMFSEDQKIRVNNYIDLEPIDKKHRSKVFVLLANGLIKTKNDKLNAALFLQHTALTYCGSELKSMSAENYMIAYYLSQSAYDSGEQNAVNFVAATLDRYLLYTEGYQKYGTQRIFDENTGEEMWAPIDSVTPDEERIRHGVPDKATLLRRFKIKHK